MKTIEEVMSEVNAIFALKSNQDLTHKERMDLLQTIIENQRSEAHNLGYRQGQHALFKKISSIFEERLKS